MSFDAWLMNRRKWIMLSGAALAAGPGRAAAPQSTGQPPPVDVEPDKLLLKDYRPKSIYKIPASDIKRAKYPIVDTHHHARPRNAEEVDRMVEMMDKVNVERVIAFSGTGEPFDTTAKLLAKYPKRFDIWCGLDMRDVDQPAFGPATVKELERCQKAGAVGVGEVSDKGMGIGGIMGGPSNWQGTRPKRDQGAERKPAGPRQGLHPHDPKMDPVWRRCAELGMPVNLHMSDPYWSYLPQDRHNDGLMNGFSWRLDNQPGILGHDGLLQSLENTLKRHPKTVFICCHLANLDYDLTRLGQMFDRNPNMYADISARFAETAPIPRFAGAFLKKYAHRVTYGTDMPYTQEMFTVTFRIMESLDEHFYAQEVFFNFNYHWPLHGLGLPDDALRKIYRDTALAAIGQARGAAKA